LLSHKFGASPEKFKDETAIQEKIDEQNAWLKHIV
jgi:hypothetical protein